MIKIVQNNLRYYKFYNFWTKKYMNLLRKLQFMIKGYLNFTRREQPLPALTGSLNQKIFVITGGNSGIGYAAAS